MGRLLEDTFDETLPMTQLTRCPRCSLSVSEETLHSSVGTTLFWRCKCGWSKCVAESGTYERPSVQRTDDDAIELGKVSNKS